MNEYRFRQCPKDGNIQCNKSKDRCEGCPIAKAAPAPTEGKEIRRMTNPKIAARLRAYIAAGEADNTELMYEKLSRYEDTGLEPEEIKIRWERTR